MSDDNVLENRHKGDLTGRKLVELPGEADINANKLIIICNIYTVYINTRRVFALRWVLISLRGNSPVLAAMFLSSQAADVKDKISTARLSEMDLAPSVSVGEELRSHSDAHAYRENQTKHLGKSLNTLWCDILISKTLLLQVKVDSPNQTCQLNVCPFEAVKKKKIIPVSILRGDGWRNSYREENGMERSLVPAGLSAQHQS